MRVSKILYTLLLFGPLAIEANEATAPKDGNSPVTAVDSATGRDVHTTAKPVSGQALARTAAGKRAAAKDPDTGAAIVNRPATTQQVVRTNADRLRSLLATQARGRVVRQPVSRPVGSARAPTLMDGARQERLGTNRTQFGTAPARQPARGVASPAPVASPSAARPVSALSVHAIHSTNGLPRAPGLAVVGGPVAGRGVHNSSIDGTQLRRKF